MTSSTFTVASSYLESLYAVIASSLTQVTRLLSGLKDSVLLPLSNLIGTYSSKPLSPEDAITFVAPVLIILFMAGWSKRFWPSGRYSPFSSPVGPAPTVTEDDYHYLGPDDIVDPPRQGTGYGFPLTHADSKIRHNFARVDSGSTPDVLTLKHRGTSYILQFPAFSIGEGLIKVGELRRIAAEKTKADDLRRIRLLYKGKVLKDDHKACCDEGMKQNSEVMCVVSSGAKPYREDESSESADEEEMLENGLRVEVDGTVTGAAQKKRKGHRGGTKKKRNDSVEPMTGPRDSGFLGGQETPYRSESPTRQPHGFTAPPVQPQPHQSPQNPNKTKTPLDKLDDIARTFHTKFVPQAVQFIAHPPEETKVKDFEYKKLSESILAQVILKLDEVTTEGDEGARTKRKELVKETQKLLGRLDDIGKSAS